MSLDPHPCTLCGIDDVGGSTAAIYHMMEVHPERAIKHSIDADGDLLLPPDDGLHCDLYRAELANRRHVLLGRVGPKDAPEANRQVNASTWASDVHALADCPFKDASVIPLKTRPASITLGPGRGRSGRPLASEDSDL